MLPADLTEPGLGRRRPRAIRHGGSRSDLSAHDRSDKACPAASPLNDPARQSIVSVAITGWSRPSCRGR